MDGLILLDARLSCCSDEPHVRAHMYLFALYRKVPATYIYIYTYNIQASEDFELSSFDSTHVILILADFPAKTWRQRGLIPLSQGSSAINHPVFFRWLPELVRFYLPNSGGSKSEL